MVRRYFQKLYDDGLEIHGQDFSKNMLDIAQKKMPKSKLYEGDFAKALDKNILNEKYDAILATYSIHHIIDAAKKDFLMTLISLLNDDGKIFIGDVSFLDKKSLESCREKSKDYWDDDEHYIVYESIKKDFPNAIFEKNKFLFRSFDFRKIDFISGPWECCGPFYFLQNSDN